MARNADPILNALEGKPGPGELAPGMPLDDFPPYLLNRIVNRLNLELAEELKGIGVTLQHYRVLAVLIARDRRTVNELAVYTVTEQSTLSKLLDRMGEANLIERQPDPRDGRVVIVSITDTGRATYDRMLPIAWRHYRRAMAHLSEPEEAGLVEMLHGILANIRRSPYP
jgi:DNA-binding MarR family transcriptional regulator